jgi:hypothetical protein
MKIKRFYWVTAPKSGTVHILLGRRVEGEKLACGRRTSWPGWFWHIARPPKSERCKRCIKAVKKLPHKIMVQRVRDRD